MSRYRKKPVVVDAEPFFPDRRPWPRGVFSREATAADFGKGQKYTAYFIETLEGAMKVTPGDWIITGVKGERYPCKPDIFELTYEPAEESE